MMNSSDPKGSDSDIIKWYNFNIDCMIRSGIEVVAVDRYEDISNTVFFDTEAREVTTIIEEGAEHCLRFSVRASSHERLAAATSLS